MSSHCADPGRVSEGCQVPGGVWHHHHNGAHRGTNESLQWTGGRTPEADELRLCPHRPLRLHETVLHQRNWKLVSWIHVKTTSSFSSICCINDTNIHDLQVLVLLFGSWRAVPQGPWLWRLHSQQMWWRCVSRHRCDWLMVKGDTMALWTRTRRLPETKVFGDFGKVVPFPPLTVCHHVNSLQTF